MMCGRSRQQAQSAGTLGQWLIRLGIGVVAFAGWLIGIYTWLTAAYRRELSSPLVLLARGGNATVCLQGKIAGAEGLFRRR
jgi:hypothetical protein